MPGSMERIPPVIADRYRVLDELGRGGMGVVFRARDLKHERDVAVKILRPELASALEAHRFHREIHIAASLSHPHILPIYDSGDVEGLLYYVMPHVPGETLQERLDQRGRLSIPEVLTLARNVATALDHAHARTVVHRDIKPANIFLSGEEALVGDFGVAVVLDEALRDRRITSPGVSVGSPRYMSPEQLTDPERVDWRADVFSYGTVLFECITGHLPFAEEEGSAHPMGWMARKPGKLGDDCPRPLADFVHRCLAVDPHERIPEGRTLGEAWRDTEENVARLRRLDSRPALAWRAAAVGGALLVILAAAGVAFLVAPAPSLERTVVRHEPVVAWPSREEGGRIVPGRAEISFLSDRNGGSDVWAVPWDGGGERQVTREERRVTSHAWSPDGTRLAYVIGRLLILADADGELTGDRIQLPESRLPPRLVRWREGTLYLLLDGRLWSLDIETSQPAPVATVRGLPTILSADVHPHEGRVAFTTSRDGEGTDLWVADLDGSPPERVTDDAAIDVAPCWLGPEELAFVSNRGGQMDVWRMASREGPLRAVTTGAAGVTSIDCASDGSAVTIDRQSERAELWLRDPVRDRSTLLTSGGPIHLLPSSSVGGRVAFQRERAEEDVRGPLLDADILLGTLSDGRLVDVETLAESGFHPRISSDGRWVVFQRLPSPAGTYLTRLVVASAAGGEWPLTDRFPMGTFRADPPLDWETDDVAWSDAGATLYYVEAGADASTSIVRGRYLTRARMTADGPTIDTVATFDTRHGPADLAVSPGGDRLAYVVRSEVGEHRELRVLDVAEGRERMLYREELAPELYTVGWLGPDGPLVVVQAFLRSSPVTIRPLLVGMDGRVEERALLRAGLAGYEKLDPSSGDLLAPGLNRETLELRRLALETPGASWGRTLEGIPFSGLEVLADGRLLFSRHEVNPDVWRVIFSGPG